MNDRPLVIANRLNEIRSELHNDTEEVRLIAVTKYSPVEDVVFAYEANQFDFGENRVTDLKEKAEYFYEHSLKSVRWHFIGHLQSNKVKELLKIPNLYSIHSIDSLKLIEELLKRKNEFDGILNIFLQVNTSHEDEKSGFESTEELYKGIELLLAEPKFKFYGLMTMGTIRTDHPVEEAHRCFKELAELKNKIENDFNLKDLKLSMGMSNDYQIALAHGTSYIRIGTKIFK
jgi:pyridoxal phosphate enzyme (YggS family)